MVRGTTTILNSNGGIFPRVSVNEILRSIQYKDICQMMVVDCSMRSAAIKIERMLHRGCNHRTLDDWVQREGNAIVVQIDKQSREALEECGFDSNTGKVKEGVVLKEGMTHPEIAVVSQETVVEIIRKYNENREENEKINERWVNGVYEKTQEGVNISIDDVGVTEQKGTGRQKNSPKKETKKRVENTVIHIGYGIGTYILTGLGIFSVVKNALAFLLKNNLLMNQMLTFFVDGAPNIKNAIQSLFGWRPYKIILDWHHLDKKCAERLSLIMKGRKLRNETYKILVKFLWYGELDAAIAYLKAIPEDKIKSKGLENIELLIAYFERNREFLPCYALRKELGLRNSSNRVEKSNDLVVAVRQKNKGMSWSRPGSTALANITAVIINHEISAWNYTGHISYTVNYHDKIAV